MANELSPFEQGFAPAKRQNATNTTTEMMVTRQAQEVQAAMVIAQRFPRDQFKAIEGIKRACMRPTLASQALYSYPRGGQTVTGPSIRLAEALAQNWGNIDYGLIELEQKDGRSEMMAYAWDLETNTRVSKIFTVEHRRDTKKGSVKLTDARDIYEATANFGSRRMRACILEVIPGDVVDEAVNMCKETVARGDGRSMQERIQTLLDVFKREYKVSREQIEEYIGLNAGAFGTHEIILMQSVYKALKDGEAKVDDFFPQKKAIEQHMDPFAQKEAEVKKDEGDK